MEQTAQKTFFGQPRGLATLFFTEMWERMSYYGMRAILMLYMVALISEGGMELTEKNAAAIYGLYTFGVYVLGLLGGYLADNFLGQRKAVWYGGILITAGHFSMALPVDITFFLGLLLIVLGTGLLKPNVSTIVGDLYPEGGARRDAGFAIFYTGINLGAFLGPLVCGYLGENVNWHLGFGAAGIGMVFGLIQFKMTEHHLGEAGIQPKGKEDGVESKSSKGLLGIMAVVLVGIVLVLQFSGNADFTTISGFASGTGYVTVALMILYFLYLLVQPTFTKIEKKRILLIFVLLMACAMFWSGFEQAGTSLNLFAKYFTDLEMGSFTMPASWLQSVNPIFIIVLSPFFGALWINLAKRNLNPKSPLKFSMGLIFLGLGFYVMVVAAKLAAESPVAPFWLCLCYLLHTTGELCLSPVGLSTITKLAPKRIVGQMMGTWFMATALGNLVAAKIAGNFDFTSFSNADDAMKALDGATSITPELIHKLPGPVKEAVGPEVLEGGNLQALKDAVQGLLDTAMTESIPQIPELFNQTFLFCFIAGLILLAFSHWLKKLAPDVE